MRWHTEKKVINDLIPYDKNPRQMTEKQNKDLEASLKKFDLVEIPAINKDGTILAGHQRLRILQSLGRGGEEIDVRVPDRQLDEKEVQEYNVRSNKNTGEWNFDILGNNFEVEDLLKWGFNEKELKLLYEDDFYTRKIEIPIYIPNDNKPKLENLINTDKRDELIKFIINSKINDEDKKFLSKERQ